MVLDEIDFRGMMSAYWRLRWWRLIAWVLLLPAWTIQLAMIGGFTTFVWTMRKLEYGMMGGTCHCGKPLIKSTFANAWKPPCDCKYWDENLEFHDTYYCGGAGTATESQGLAENTKEKGK